MCAQTHNVDSSVCTVSLENMNNFLSFGKYYACNIIVMIIIESEE